MKQLATIAAALMAAPLLAQAPAAQPSPEAVKAATAVVDLMSPPDRAKAQLDNQLKELRAGAGIRAQLSSNPAFRMEAAKNKPAFNATIARMGGMQADTLGPILREMQPATRQATIDAYASSFTVEELNAIAAFYSSPTGAKLRAQQPAIGQDVNKQMQQRFGARMQSAEKALAPKLSAEARKLAPAAPQK